MTDGHNYRIRQIEQFFEGQNINGQHLRPPVVAILLEGKILMDCQYFCLAIYRYRITGNFRMDENFENHETFSKINFHK